MKKTLIIVVAVIIVGVGIYYFISNNNSGGNPSLSAPGNSSPTSSVTTPGEEVTINLKNFSFDPAAKTIKVGTKVTWVNNDTVAHTITSDTGSLLNSSPIAPGRSFSFVFTSPASDVNYHCKIHPTMKGSITVVELTTP